MSNKSKNIKPLIIGIGIAGRRHLDAQLNLGNKTGVFTTNPQSVKDLGKNRNVIVFSNLEQGIEWANLVHVCTPDDKHTKFIEMAMKAKIAVLSEKPLTTNLKEALYLQRLAHEYNTPLIVGQNYRLTPTFAQTKKMILARQLGIITKIETTYLHDKFDYQRRYLKKNFLYTGGSHAIDLACWIVDKPIVSIKATAKNELNFQIVIKFSQAIYGYIKLDASIPRAISGTDLTVYGEDGKLITHNKKDQLLFYPKGGTKPQTIHLPNTQTFTTPLEVKIVNDYLLGKIPSYSPLPGVDEAVNVMKVLDATEKSCILRDIFMSNQK